MVQFPIAPEACRTDIDYSHAEPGRSMPSPPAYESAKNQATFAPADDLVVLLMNQLEADPRIYGYNLVDGTTCEAVTACGRISFAPLPTTGSRRKEAFDFKFGVRSDNGGSVLLVSEWRLRRRWLMDNCAMVASSGRSDIAPFDRIRVLDRLKAEGGTATLGDLAAIVGTPGDPVRSVLSLIPKGLVSIDLDRPIDADSVVSRMETTDAR